MPFSEVDFSLRQIQNTNREDQKKEENDKN